MIGASTVEICDHVRRSKGNIVSLMWSVFFGGEVKIYFNVGKRDWGFSGGLGGIGMAQGWSWGTLHYNDPRQFNDDKSAIWVGPVGPYLSVKSKGVPYPEREMRMEYMGGGLPGVGVFGGLGGFY